MRTVEDINKLIDFVKENPLNFSWLNPNTTVKESTIPNAGNGRFATHNMKTNETIAILGGLILTEGEYQQIRKRFDFVSGVLIDKDIKLHQINFISDNNGSLNHSCNPNASFSGQISIKTIRSIKAGEELFIDYSTIADQDLVLFEDCQCGAENCRKYVTCKDWLSPSFRMGRDFYFSYYLSELIRDTSKLEMKKQLESLKKIDRSKSSILSEDIVVI